MLRRNQGYIPENEMRMQRMDNGTFARYRKGRSPREQEIMNGPDSQRLKRMEKKRYEMMRLRENILSDHHNSLRHGN